MRWRIPLLLYVLSAVTPAAIAEPDDKRIPVPDEMRACTHDSDCEVVDRSCSMCSISPDQYASVNRSHLTEFNIDREAQCRIFSDKHQACLMNIKFCGSGKCLNSMCTYTIDHAYKGECPSD